MNRLLAALLASTLAATSAWAEDPLERPAPPERREVRGEPEQGLPLDLVPPRKPALPASPEDCPAPAPALPPAPAEIRDADARTPADAEPADAEPADAEPADVAARAEAEAPAPPRPPEGPAGRLAALIQRSEATAAPTLSFLAGLRDLGDVRLDRAGIEAALRAARLTPGSPIAEVLAATTAIRLQGGRVTLERSQATQIAVASGARILLAKRVSLRVAAGRVEALTGEARDRLAAADRPRGFVQLTDFSGVKVGEGSGSLYALYDLFMVEEQGVPVVHLRAGVSFLKKWKRLAFPPVTADAGTPPVDAAGIVGSLSAR